MQIHAVTTQYNTNHNVQLFKGMNAAKAKNAAGRAYDAFTDVIAHTEGKLAGTSVMKKFINFMKDKNYQQHIVAAVGLVLSGFYMADTARSKNIEEDQKLPLILNQGVVSVASTIGGYTLDNYLTKKLNNFTETFNIANISDEKIQKTILKMHEKKDSLEKSDFENLFQLFRNEQENRHFTFEKDIKDAFDVDSGVLKQLNKELKKNPENKTVKKALEEINAIPKTDANKVVKVNEIFIKYLNESPLIKKIFSKGGFKQSLKLVTENQKNLSQLMTGLKIAKSLMVFGLIYRFISPVIATPIANSISTKIEKTKRQKLSG